MAENIIEKRKFMWKITNFTHEAASKYGESKRVESEKFDILLGTNLTEWCFRLYPNKVGDYCGFYIHKVAADRDDFLFKLRVTIQKNDDTMANTKNLEKESNAISLGEGRGWPKFWEFNNNFDAEYEYLANDTLTLIINLELHQYGPPAKKPRLDLALPVYMAKYFNSEVLSDVSVICSDEKSIPGHRFILASRSAVFEKMLTTDMAEKKLDNITVVEDGETMMELMRYLYIQEVQDLKKHAPRLLDCAEKYDIPDLKLMCVQEIGNLSNENVLENLLLAKLYNERKLMEKCMDHIETNFMKLKDSGEWKKIDSELMVSIMNYMRDKLKGIEFTNSL